MYVSFPDHGAKRVHLDPARLPKLAPTGEPGVSRFDDPLSQYVVRYLATNLEGCLVEVLGRFRENSTAEDRLRAVPNVEPEGVSLDADPTEAKHDGVTEYLQTQRVAVAAVSPTVEIVRINDAVVLGTLNRHPDVRAALDASGLGSSDEPAELDEGTIRLRGAVGRVITRAVSRAIYELPTHPGGVRYFSRLDDSQECWAIFDRVTVRFDDPVSLSPAHGDHRRAVAYACEVLHLDVPPEWR